MAERLCFAACWLAAYFLAKTRPLLQPGRCASQIHFVGNMLPFCFFKRSCWRCLPSHQIFVHSCCSVHRCGQKRQRLEHCFRASPSPTGFDLYFRVLDRWNMWFLAECRSRYKRMHSCDGDWILMWGVPGLHLLNIHSWGTSTSCQEMFKWMRWTTAFVGLSELGWK